MKTWRTNKRFARNEEDLEGDPIKSTDLIKISTLWSVREGDYVSIKNKYNPKEKYNGKVIGFNKTGQKGRVLFVETSPGICIWLDDYTNGEDYNVIVVLETSKFVRNQKVKSRRE